MDSTQNIMRPAISERLHELRFTRFLNSRMLPKREPGHCRWCGKKSKSIHCSSRCSKESYIRMGYGVQQDVFERDKGFCTNCSIDTHWLYNEIKKIKRTWRRSLRDIWYPEMKAAFGPWWTDNYRLWEADHIIPVCEGGGCCGLENYQTLCLKCHKAESATLAGKRAKKQLTAGQMELFVQS